jgi:hypothetical protein
MVSLSNFVSVHFEYCGQSEDLSIYHSTSEKSLLETLRRFFGISNPPDSLFLKDCRSNRIIVFPKIIPNGLRLTIVTKRSHFSNPPPISHFSGSDSTQPHAISRRSRDSTSASDFTLTFPFPCREKNQRFLNH